MGKKTKQARCSCGATGPKRGRAAIDAGWVSASGPGDPAAWLCPGCAPRVAQERSREHQERLAQSSEATFTVALAPRLGVVTRDHEPS